MKKNGHTGVEPIHDLKRIAADVVRRAGFVIESFGPRPPGSVAETQTLDYARELLGNSEEIATFGESFSFAPMAFFQMQRVSAVLGMVGFSLYWIHPSGGLICGLLALLVQYHQLLRYHLFLDPFFPKKESRNFWAQLEPTTPATQTIILNAHPDAAYEWRWLRMFPKWFGPLVGFMLGCLFLLPILSMAGWWMEARGLDSRMCGIALCGLVPGFVLAYFFNDLDVVAPGANDNLSGMFLAMGVFEEFASPKNRLRQTRLVFLLTGAEEAGLRGAKAWAARHKGSFDLDSTFVITLDTIRDLDHLRIYSRDLNGTVAHDPAVCRWLRESANETGHPAPFGSIFLGASDAAALTQAGFRSATIAAMDPSPAHYYHTRRDTPEAMNPECLRVVADLLFHAIAERDKTGPLAKSQDQNQQGFRPSTVQG